MASVLRRRFYRVALRSISLDRPGVRTFLTAGTPFKINLSRQADLARPLADKFFPATSIADLPAALVANRTGAAGLLDAIARSAPATPAAGTLYDSRSDEDGHLCALATRVDHGSEAASRFLDPRFPLRSAFSAFPNGIRLLSAEMGEAFLEAPDAVAFLKDNEEAIDSFQSGIIGEAKPAGWSYEGNYLVLGSGSLVRCMQHEIVPNDDGSAVHVWHMQTSSRHMFDGSFLWGWRFDAKDGTMIVGAGLQAGKHPWYDIDTVNAWGGAGLFDYMNRAAPFLLDAADRGVRVTPGDIALVGDAFLRAAGRFLASAERFSPVGQYLRDNGPPNTRAEIVLLDADALDEAQAQGPEAFEQAEQPPADAVGVTLDGSPLPLQEAVFGTPIGPPGEDQVLDAMDDLLQFEMSQENWEKIRSDVLDHASGMLGDRIATWPIDELFGALLADPASRVEIERIVDARLLGPAMPQLQMTIESVALASGDQDALRESARLHLREAVTLPLLAEGGALRSAIVLRLLDRQVAELNAATLDTRAAAAGDKAASAAAEADRLRKQVLKDDAEREELDRAIADQETAEASALEDQSRADAQRDDLLKADEIRDQQQKAERSSAETLFPEG
jgi:hypothetical protein